MALIIQYNCMVRKKHSLVLNSLHGDHRAMTTTQKTSKIQRFRAFARYAWGDQVAANRALLRTQSYQDYLLNRRGR